MLFIFFFKQKTAYEMRISDWSSDLAGGPLLDNLNLFNELITRLSDAGYASDDIQWAENTKPPEHAEEFATETIFVICNSGMKHTIARKIFDKCMEAIANGVSCATVFGHKGKSAAMDHIWATSSEERRVGKEVSVRVNYGGRRLIK